MSYSQQSLGQSHYDDIRSLPIDNTQASPTEVQLLNNIFNEKTVTSPFMSDLKWTLMGGVLFIILSLPIVINKIQSFTSKGKDKKKGKFDISGIMIRAVIFMALFYFIKNIWRVKK